LRVLSLSPRQCQPAVTGAKLRDYYLARAFGETGDLTYIYFREAGAAPAEMPFCRELIGVERPRPYTAGKILRGIAGRWPLPVLNYTSAAMLAEARRCLAAARFDLVYIDAIHLAACERELRSAPGAAPVVYNWHNIESELMERFSGHAKSRAKRWYARLTARRLAGAEEEILGSAYGHIVCSEREKEELLRRAPSARIAVVENGVDAAAFRDDAPAGARTRIVFVGAMNYRPNADAAVWFARSLWAGIREQFPELRLTIVGGDPGPEVVALRDIPGVEVTGRVPQIQPYYRDAMAAVVPLRVGGGTRLKIVEAMAAGVPVISTAIGAEGLMVEDGATILIAQEDAAWARALRTLQDTETRSRIVDRARALATSRYDWNVIGKGLVEACARWAEEAAVLRKVAR